MAMSRTYLLAICLFAQAAKVCDPWNGTVHHIYFLCNFIVHGAKGFGIFGKPRLCECASLLASVRG